MLKKKFYKFKFSKKKILRCLKLKELRLIDSLNAERIYLKTRSATPSPSPSPRHSNVRPSNLPLQVAPPRPPDPIHRLAPHRGMLHSRQASNNSNQQSSLDDSGVVDDHDGDDVTSAEEHERREHHHREHKHREHRLERQERMQMVTTTTGERTLLPIAPVTVSVRSKSREIRVLKCNGVKTKKQMYTLPPEYLSHIVVIGKNFTIIKYRTLFLKVALSLEFKWKNFFLLRIEESRRMLMIKKKSAFRGSFKLINRKRYSKMFYLF